MNQEEKRELFKSWLDGTISANDRKRLEVEALDDDFLFEAMEGLATNLSKNSDRLGALEQKLGQRIHPIKVKRIWLVPAAAATIIAIVAAVFLLREDTEISSNEHGELYSQVESPEVVVEDSNVEDQIAELSLEEPVKNASEGEVPAEAKDARNQSIVRENESLKPLAVAKVKEGPFAIIEDEVEVDIADDDSEMFNGDLKREYTPPPAAAQEAGADMAKMDADSYAEEEEAKETISAVPTASKKRASAATISSADREVGKSQPEMGYEAFRKFIESNKQRTLAADEHNISGIVKLRFNVNKSGKPVQIKVISGLGYGLDEEAILLLESSKWTPGENNEIEIEF